MGSYEEFDTSKHRLKLEDPHFPAYLRLFKWKILDILIGDTTNEGFFMLKNCFPKGESEIEEIIHNIRYTENVLAEQKPDMNVPKLDSSRFNASELSILLEKRDIYIQCLRQQGVQLERRRYIDFFFKKVLYCEEGIRTIDRLLHKFSFDVFSVVHLTNVKETVVVDTFFKNFYNDQDENNQRTDVQLLDRVSRAARGNLIYNFFRNNQQFEREQRAIEMFLNFRSLEINTTLVDKVIDEGPQNYIERNAEGDETPKSCLIWNEHKTLLTIASFPLIGVSEQLENDNDDWYFNVLDSMSRDPHNRAALWFLNKDYERVLDEKEKKRQQLRMQRLEGLDGAEKEEEVGEEELMEIRKQPWNDDEYEEDHETLVLRDYQEELVLPALRGHNVVIVAPTGSGKTEVAIYAALKHIEGREEKKLASRVVMLVPKIPLVGQQRDRFLKYCRGKYYVEGFHGSENSSNGHGRKDEVLKSHIVVMTPQILLNMWRSVRSSEKLYISDFSMVIFDEVHKTTGNHPYGEIAQMVQMFNGPKPQVIGLTASLNVKATATTDQIRMLTEIYKLLAVLNATVLSAIHTQRSLMELNKHVSKPDDSVIICHPPVDRQAMIRKHIKQLHKTLHEKLVTEIERLSKIRSGNVFPQNFLRNAKRLDKMPGGLEDTFSYDNWLQNVTQNLNKINSADKMIAQINTKYLKVIIEARGIVEVMPAYVAYDFLSEQMDQLRSQYNLPQFSEKFDNTRRQLTERKFNKEDNADPEIVQYLKDTIKQQFDAIPDSRAIIFVTQRTTAERVCHFLNQANVLNVTHGEAFGYVLGSNNQGVVKQTAQQQKNVIDRFNNGKLKVIVATSVVEEGLDVATCNLIIKYNCSSGSAVQLTQQRGRARAKNSKSVLLVVTSKVNENENNAMIAEKHMRWCVKTIIEQGPNHLISQVNNEKEKIRREREQHERELKDRKNELQSKLYDIQCSKCAQVLCKSDSIKKIFSNYVIMDPDVWNKLQIEQRKKALKFVGEESQPLATLKCDKCLTPCGKVLKQCGAYVPQIDVRVLAFIDKQHESQELITKAKWTTVESELFFIAEAKTPHFKSMLNALNNSEANLIKKQILDYEMKQITSMIDERDRREKYERERDEKKKRDKKNVIKAKWDEEDVEEDEQEGEKEEDDDEEEEEKKEQKEQWIDTLDDQDYSFA